jgi:hypothetical protein
VSAGLKEVQRGIHLQHGSRDMDKRVNAVEEGHDRLVSIEEK